MQQFLEGLLSLNIPQGTKINSVLISSAGVLSSTATITMSFLGLYLQGLWYLPQLATSIHFVVHPTTNLPPDLDDNNNHLNGHRLHCPINESQQRGLIILFLQSKSQPCLVVVVCYQDSIIDTYVVYVFFTLKPINLLNFIPSLFSHFVLSLQICPCNISSDHPTKLKVNSISTPIYNPGGPTSSISIPLFLSF